MTRQRLQLPLSCMLSFCTCFAFSGRMTICPVGGAECGAAYGCRDDLPGPEEVTSPAETNRICRAGGGWARRSAERPVRCETLTLLWVQLHDNIGPHGHFPCPRHSAMDRFSRSCRLCQDRCAFRHLNLVQRTSHLLDLLFCSERQKKFYFVLKSRTHRCEV